MLAGESTNNSIQLRVKAIHKIVKDEIIRTLKT